MSSRLMALPAELRVRIYEYTFCDSVPDEAGVFCANDKPAEESAGPEERATAEDSATPGPNTTVKKAHRQIDLLKAKDHYPQPALLCTCKLIHHEAEPIFEAATKVFWDIDVFNINFTSLPHPEIGREERHKHYLLPQLLSHQSKLESMSLLQKCNIKSPRFPWSHACLAIAIDEERQILLRISRGTAPIHWWDDEVTLAKSLFQVFFNNPAMVPQYRGKFFNIAKVLCIFLLNALR